MKLIHGTTRYRAERIIALGPDPAYREHPGNWPVKDGFSMYCPEGPFLFEPSEVYARRKHRDYPTEGGAVILEIDVPKEIIDFVVNISNGFYDPVYGVIVFDRNLGIEELLAAWPEVSKTAIIRELP